ncbi:probable E3 ubiquitin-protein ligase DTX3 [Gigantopelta aegis]|uniref:probable E3 ubiquitin-protein ligase DTX3 n=1 Tax=Gigantopelta aegis TaxID=1735272 RepID=UPI001B88B936|nr:probable E3 ubiquitin-protein ligase DTX3 [Gigantopelta aegis]
MEKDSPSNTSSLREPMHEMDTNGPGSDGRSTHVLPPESPPISSFDIIDDICVICIDIVSEPKILDKCGHVFCCGCIDKCFQVFKPVCPICNTIYGVIIGNQPPGSMTVKHEPYSLPGHSDCGTIKIMYHFNSGVQGPENPNPGSRYHGTTRTAYLPDSPEGNKVLCLLQIAFERRVTFTIGISLTTGQEDVITWNDIHHKTRCDGNAKGFGYPDPTYLSRIVEELKCKGITEADL